MIQLPKRLDGLIKKIEAGETVTQEDLDRIATLQALDIAMAGRRFVEEWAAREAEYTEELKTVLQ